MDEWLSDCIARRETDSPPSDAEIDVAFQELVKNMARHIVEAEEAPGSEAFGALENRVDATRRDLTKSVRGLTSKRMWEIIGRLREDLPLADADKTLIRMWLIGDAEAYLIEENNLADWKRELARLRGEIDGLASASATPENLQILQALLSDAHNVIMDIARFHNERERIEHFERTMSDRMDSRDRSQLADVLVAAYQSRGL